jgi:hypothetical protein
MSDELPVYLEVAVSQDSLAETLACSENDELVDFILKVDALVAQVEFTEALIEKLQDALAGEDL